MNKFNNLTVKSFTISRILEVNRGGGKESHFLSMTFESPPISPEEAVIQQLHVHALVDKAVIYDAVASGTVTVDTGKDLVDQSKERHDAMLSTLRKNHTEQAIRKSQTPIGTCNICSSPVLETPSGPICGNGHGGAPYTPTNDEL
jgi:hypothetical protein